MPIRYGNTYRAFRGLAGLVLIGLAWPSLAQETKAPSETAYQTEQPNAEEAEPERPPAATPREQEISPPAVNEQPTHDANYYSDADLDAQRRMAVASEELADLTGNQIVIGGIEIVLLVLAVSLAAWAAVAASRAANAANAAVVVASKTAKRQLRAYVTTEESIWAQTGDNWCFTHYWKNTGPTPALRTLTHANWEAFDGDIPDNFDYPDTGREQGNDPAVIGPGQTLLTPPIFIPRRITNDPGQNIYIWGWADYDDIFNDTLRHRTEFCFQVRVEVGLGVKLRIYRRFNGADDDCYRQPEPV